MKTIAALWEMCRTPGAPTKRKPQSHHRDWGIVPSPKPEPTSPLMWTPMMHGTPPPPYSYPTSQAYPISQAFPMPHTPLMPQVFVKSEPTLITNKQCLWCVCQKGGCKEFCRKGKVQEHLDKQHLSWFSPGAAISCPDDYCRNTLIWSSNHFKNHVDLVHRAPRSYPSQPQTHSCAQDIPMFGDCMQAQQVMGQSSMYNFESQFTFVDYQGGNQMVMC